MKKNLLLLLSLITFGNTVSMQAPDTNHIRTMSFNIRTLVKEKDPKNNWINRRNQVIELIKSLHPDIMGLQEPTIEQVKDLDTALKTNYAWFGTARGSSWMGMGPSEYNPIFYNTQRLELQESGTFVINPCSKIEYILNLKKYGLLPRICTWGKFKDKATQQEFFVFNTHLDHLYATAQAHGLETIMKFMDKHTTPLPIIFMGDFNTEITPNLQKTTLRDFIHPKSLASKITGPDETYTGWYFNELKKIDHILINKNAPMKVIQYSTIQETNKDTLPSDHRPVLVDLAFEK